MDWSRGCRLTKSYSCPFTQKSYCIRQGDRPASIAGVVVRIFQNFMLELVTQDDNAVVGPLAKTDAVNRLGTLPASGQPLGVVGLIRHFPPPLVVGRGQQATPRTDPASPVHRHRLRTGSA